MSEGRAWHWRNTMKPVRFFKFDVRVSYALLLILMHPRLYTLAIFLSIAALSWVLERKGLSMSAALRALRVWLIGKYRPPFLGMKKRRLLDTGTY